MQTYTLDEIEAEFQHPPTLPQTLPEREQAIREAVILNNLHWTPEWLTDHGRWTLASIIRSKVLGDYQGAGELKCQWEEYLASRP